MEHKKIYTEKTEKIEKIFTETIQTFEPKAYKSDNICALPLLPIKNKNVLAFKGGLCDTDFTYLREQQKRMFFCKEGYKVKNSELQICDEEVVFGGVFFNHFGVMLLLSLTRLWWAVENSDDSRKIIFLCEEGNGNAEKFCVEIMRLLGIDKKRYQITHKPTLFSKILIPDEAWSDNNKISEKLFLPYRTICERLLKKYPEETPKKIYFSRSKFTKPNRNPDGINEEYYENFYKRRGFEIVYPEKLPLELQIRYIAGAEEYVSTYGTLAHFGPLFLNDGAKQIMLQRAEIYDQWFFLQMRLLIFRNLDWSLVAATKNPYPTHHDGGVFFYYPTDYFREYLNNNQIGYNEDELKYEATPEEVSEYIRRWLCVYSSPKGFKFLNQPELFPVLQALYYQSTGKLLNPKDYLE